MNRKLTAMLLACCTTLTLCSCAGNSSPAESGSSSEAASSGGESAPKSNVSLDWMGADLNGVAGAVGGGWYSTFAAFTEMITEKEPLITFRVSPGSGIGNSATISDGTFDIGWIYPPMAQLAYNGEAPYEKAYGDIRIIAAGFSPQTIEVVARANVDVENIDDIFNNKMGIRWLTPNKGSTTPALYFDIMLQYYGVTEDDIASWGGSTTYTPYSDWSQLAQDGHIDIMFNQGSMPFSTTQEIAANTDLKLLSLPEELQKFMIENYALEQVTIPGNTYAFEPDDTSSLQMSSGLGCNAAVDDDTVYRILEIIEANIEDFRAINPSFANFSLETAWQNTGDVPLHPGAEKFYKDHGYMK